jgi:hypothetical protein
VEFGKWKTWGMALNGEVSEAKLEELLKDIKITVRFLYKALDLSEYGVDKNWVKVPEKLEG